MDRIVYLFYRAASRGLSLLPLGLVFRLGAFAGWLAHLLLWPYRRLVLENLAIAFAGEKSPGELRTLARQHFCRLGANLLSSIRIASMPEAEILKRVEVENLERLTAAVAQGRGVVFIVSHMGNWEILAQVAPLVFPCKSGTIYQRLGNRYIDADIRATRARMGLTPFERKEGFQAAIALLRQGGAVGVLLDQHAGDAGTWTPFFGRLASTSPLAATLALRTGAVLLPCVVYTKSPGRWRMVIPPEIPVATRDAGSLTAEINLALEATIRQAPADWFWVHNRWKTPSPHFLLSGYKRGVVLPAGFAPEALKPFRIVIRSSNWLGDAVMTTPAVQAIKRGRMDAHVTLLAKAKLADYWRKIPEVDEVIAIAPEDSVFAVSRKLRGRFDVALLFPNSVRTALEAWLAGIPRRVGYPAQWRRKLLNQLIVPTPPKKQQLLRPARHQVYHYLQLAEKIGADVAALDALEPAGFSPFIPRPATPAGPVKIGLCPGAEYGPTKRWMPERFAEVARTVGQQTGCEWVLFGVKADLEAGALIEGQLAALNLPYTNRIGATTMAELIDGLAECALLLTNDTGTMHLAAALGVPTVAIFGSTEPRLTAPLGPGHQVLRHQVECSPCFLRECPLDFRCMKAVTVEETVAAVLRAPALAAAAPRPEAA